MGKQQMKAKAIEVIAEIIKEQFPTLKDEELKNIVTKFSNRLT